MKIRDLDDLKERLLATIVVLLAVSFLGYVVTWDGSFNLLAPGIAIGVVLVAISLLLRQFRGSSRQPANGEESRTPSPRPARITVARVVKSGRNVTMVQWTFLGFESTPSADKVACVVRA